jgi:hypothetical protein
MNGFNINSKRTHHYGVNYVVATPWTTDRQKILAFEQALLANKIEFAETKTSNNFLELTRKEESNLKVRIASLGPDVSNVLVTSGRPSYNLDFFIEEAEAIYGSYREIWIGTKPCQIVRCDATIRHLYSCSEHAFKYLWETRLGQKEDDFKYLGGRPILGGGLRLVIPAAKEPDPVNIEIKIESFFQATQDMFIETQFVWPQPRLLQADEDFDPGQRLTSVEQYATNEVCNFLLKPETEE